MLLGGDTQGYTIFRDGVEIDGDIGDCGSGSSCQDLIAINDSTVYAVISYRWGNKNCRYINDFCETWIGLAEGLPEYGGFFVGSETRAYFVIYVGGYLASAKCSYPSQNPFRCPKVLYI